MNSNSFHNRPMFTTEQMMQSVAEVADQFFSEEKRAPQFTYRATGQEQVNATVVPMEPIPVGDNPFWHDEFSMGTMLTRDWMVMHPGFDSKESPMAMDWLYLVNARTGQRIQIRLHHEPSHEQYERQKAEWLSVHSSYSDFDGEPK